MITVTVRLPEWVADLSVIIVSGLLIVRARLSYWQAKRIKAELDGNVG